MKLRLIFVSAPFDSGYEHPYTEGESWLILNTLDLLVQHPDARGAKDGNETKLFDDLSFDDFSLL